MTKTHRSLLVSAIVLIGYWMLIFTLTHIPRPAKTLLGDTRPPIPHFDKIAHFGIYFILAMLLLWFLFQSRRALRSAAGITIGTIVCYGVFDEFLQSFVPTRQPDVFDFFADVAGGLTGVIVFIAIRWVVLRSDGSKRMRSVTRSAEPLPAVEGEQ